MRTVASINWPGMLNIGYDSDKAIVLSWESLWGEDDISRVISLTLIKQQDPQEAANWPSCSTEEVLPACIELCKHWWLFLQARWCTWPACIQFPVSWPASLFHWPLIYKSFLVRSPALEPYPEPNPYFMFMSVSSFSSVSLLCFP